jgi:hypothetical protein
MRRQRRRTGLIIHDLSLNYSSQSDYRATGLEHLHYELLLLLTAIAGRRQLFWSTGHLSTSFGRLGGRACTLLVRIPDATGQANEMPLFFVSLFSYFSLSAVRSDSDEPGGRPVSGPQRRACDRLPNGPRRRVEAQGFITDTSLQLDTPASAHTQFASLSTGHWK